MLALDLERGEFLTIGDVIIQVVSTKRDGIRVAIDAPKSMDVKRFLPDGTVKTKRSVGPDDVLLLQKRIHDLNALHLLKRRRDTRDQAETERLLSAARTGKKGASNRG